MRVITAQTESKISKIVRGIFPLLGGDVLRRAFERRDFKVNGVRTGSDVILKKGDELAVYIDDKLLYPRAELVFADANIAVANKPSGIDTPAFAELVAQNLGRDIFAAHRLDAQTSGLLVLAMSKQAEEELLAAFKERRAQKTYHALVFGRPVPASGSLRHFLLKDAGAALVRVYDSPKPGARTAVSEYKALWANDKTSLIEVKPHTGRTHQIRAQLAHIGCPVIGDDRYGDRARNRIYGGRLRLCSVGIRFMMPEGMLGYIDGRDFSITPPFESEGMHE